MLWAALYFPQLPLERLPWGHPDYPNPAAIIESTGVKRTIIAANKAANTLGITQGLSLKNAYAIAPNLQVQEFDETAQAEHLQQLALWAMQYSSWVSPEAPDIILIEAEASLTLFGGLRELYRRWLSDATRQHLTLCIGIATTPKAAMLFAKSGQRMPATDKQTLNTLLNNLPVERLPLDDFVFKGLRQSGIRTVKQLRQLKPAALTRRFNTGLTNYLYKLDGTLPDPRSAFVPPDTFSQGVDLPLEAPDTGALTFPLNRLLNALSGYLTLNDLGVRELSLILSHHKAEDTSVPIGFLDPTSNRTHILKTATERLNRLVLPAPVIRLTLNANVLAPIERNARDLFKKSHAQAHSIEQVMDNLAARLGRDALYIAMPDDDHRPEKAWLAQVLSDRHPSFQWPARPLWLYPVPQLANRPLTVISAVERIENGWWGSIDVRRDYFIACGHDGGCYWAYKTRQNHKDWYIHGIFA